MSKRNNTHSNSTELFSAGSEKKHIVDMKGRNGMFQIPWSLSCFIHSNIYPAANTVLDAGEMETSKKWCFPAGLQSLVEREM